MDDLKSACLLSVMMLGTVTAARAESFSAADLLQRGNDAWNQNRCVQAAEYLFAYEQKNPPALQSDTQHRNNVATIIAWCEKHAVIAGGGKADGTGSGGPAKPDVKLDVGATGSVDRRCDIYARLAIAQNDANEAARCGLSGPRWSSDYAYHFNWCRSVASAETRGESVTRTNMLNSCTP